MTPTADQHNIVSRKSEAFSVPRTLGSSLMFDHTHFVGVVACRTGNTVVIKRQFYTDLFHGSFNNGEHRLRRFYEVITAYRVTPIESFMTARTVLVDGLVVETNVFDPNDLSVRKGGVTEKTRLLLYQTPRVQLGMGIHLTIML
jgi:hypothetical protein